MSDDARPTVRQAVLETLRSHGMTTVFGNPGSTELPFLDDFPEDFTYVLALQEAVAVAMADGFAQASGKPTLAMLHSAPGTGNAMGAIYNAQVHKAPVVLAAGQQERALVTVGGHLANRDATRLPHPLVKWSHEPLRAQDVPLAVTRAINSAALPPRGPSFVSIPVDDWTAEVERNGVVHLAERAVDGRASAARSAVAELARRLEAATDPVLVAGPDIDAAGAWDAAVALCERQRLPVWASPASGGGRLGFPESHPAFQGILPLAMGAIAETLTGHDLVLVVGSSVFPYFLTDFPCELLPAGAALVAITSDPEEAARAPMGDAIVADVGLTLDALLAEVGTSDRAIPDPGPPPGEAPQTAPLSSAGIAAVLADVLPDDAIVVVETPTGALVLRDQLRLSRPNSFFYGAGGGLGWGLPAGIGVGLAQPDRPVVCVLGDGSAQYTIQGFWTAAAYRVPVTFLILRNDEYAILKFLAAAKGMANVPGLDLPGLEVAAVATDYGIASHQVTEPVELRETLSASIGSGRPEVIEVRTVRGESAI